MAPLYAKFVLHSIIYNTAVTSIITDFILYQLSNSEKKMELVSTTTATKTTAMYLAKKNWHETINIA